VVPYLLQYLRPYRPYFLQLVFGLLLGSIFQLLFPFLTQAIVDIGIRNADLSFINLILIGQLLLFAGRLTVSIIQNRILLHLGTRINVSLIADFLQQLMRLPIAYFDTKMKSLTLLLFALFFANGKEPINTLGESTGFFSSPKPTGVAIKGYDTVAYFTEKNQCEDLISISINGMEPLGSSPIKNT